MAMNRSNKSKVVVVLISLILLAALLVLYACGDIIKGKDGLIRSSAHEQKTIADTPVPQSAQPDKASSGDDADAPSEDGASPAPLIYSGDLELPVNGATGFASIDMKIYSEADSTGSSASTIKAGSAFLIQSEDADWWQIQSGEGDGWVQHRYCMINLPDVIPSIIYDDTNAYASLFRSSDKDIPGITGEKLYDAKTYNPRLERDEYLVPVLYTMSKKIYEAQQLALSEGACLKIIEAYRPYDVQMKVAGALGDLAAADPEVKAGISTKPWSVGWFIAQTASNHQRGYAIDVTLSKVKKTNTKVSGSYSYKTVTEDFEYAMQTPMHELSQASAKFKYPVSPEKKWDNVPYADVMTENAIDLHRICTDAGLSPLASEWWHFNDLLAKTETDDHPSSGRYYLEVNCLSLPAEQ
jgi:D-alanyl-D-alanine dipeptidase